MVTYGENSNDKEEYCYMSQDYISPIVSPTDNKNLDIMMNLNCDHKTHEIIWDILGDFYYIRKSF